MMTMIIRTILDRVLAAAGLLAVSPLIAAAAVAIRWEDGGPIFFRQRRIGRAGVPFALWKLRSMRPSNAATAPQITAGGDPRCTRVGLFIRRYKIDELPQLWNVLCGDMSLIGPRPEVERYVDLADPVWREVLSVRPGISDLATLIYRDEEQILAAAAHPDQYYRQTVLPDKLDLNRIYLSQRTLWTDLRLILLTIQCSFWPAGFNPERIRKSFLKFPAAGVSSAGSV